ncbi:DEAD/DEAH box helicase [Falsiporphyromonas endometrii]|uniref:DEAD/DEAH box helicase n=1 Tax=Falsiporphyromonas endometrii TaxID=1387297 RepID=A0ABV9K9A3_9PORP
MKSFQELGIIDPLQRAIEEIGFENPMPVQEAVIPYLIGEDIDLIALAQTGTGKTAAFGLPLLQKIAVCNIAPNSKSPAALVLSPTRELCLQITNDLISYSKYLDKISVVPVYGGASIEVQIKSLKRGVSVVVATPGRLVDLLNRGAITLQDTHTVVLDEADEMLNMGFMESLNEILSHVPDERHMLLFSATMPKEIGSIAKSYMHNFKEIVVGSRNTANANIKHQYYLVAARHKYLALKRIVDYYPEVYGIVFCRTRAETQDIADKLIQDGYNADALHGELSQAQRDYVMQKFRIGHIRLLIATDVAARGLDVDNLTHVIHYGLPDEAESYTHRSGRTARAGRTGLSIAICHSREKSKIKNIEKVIGREIERQFLPNGMQVCEKQLYNLANRIENEVPEENSEGIEAIMPGIIRKLDWIEREDLIRRIVSMEFSKLLDYYRTTPEIDEADLRGRIPHEKGEGKRDRKNARAEEGMKRLRINFGKSDKLFPDKLIELVNRCCPGTRIKIGKIDLFARFAFFDVEENEADTVINSMNDYEVGGRLINVEYANEDSGREEGRRRKSGRNGKREFRDRDFSFAPPRNSRKDRKKRADKKGSKKGDKKKPFYEKFSK